MNTSSREPGKSSGIVLEYGAQASAVGDLHGVLANADDVTQNPKKQDADMHNL